MEKYLVDGILFWSQVLLESGNLEHGIMVLEHILNHYLKNLDGQEQPLHLYGL
jgi:hypothetical protein